MYSLFNSTFSPLANSLFRTDFEGGGSTGAVELVWDWRLARVYDGEGHVLDEYLWEDEKRSIAATVKRLKELKLGRMSNEARALLDRFPGANPLEVSSVQNWPPLSTAESDLLQKSSLVLAESEIIDVVSLPDYRLEHLVKAVEESRSAANNLESQLSDWIGILLPSLDIDLHRTSLASMIVESNDWEVFTSQFDDVLMAEIELGEWASIHALSKQIVVSHSSINIIERSVHELANSHLPSLSALLGPSIAAQLCVTAHGRERLARMPASTIQVLGAEKSFFSHLLKGTKPPKHGYIFQHTWISRSPRSARGSIARMLASKASIAVRIDCFGGESWGEKERLAIEQKVGEIRARKKGR